jgi:hypothetical protein
MGIGRGVRRPGGAGGAGRGLAPPGSREDRIVTDLLALGLLVGIITLVVHAARRAFARAPEVRIETRELDCPRHGRRARVDFVVDGTEEGTVYADVAACSLAGPAEL